MTKELKNLVELARRVSINPSDAETQRRSFAYGNTHFENRRITRKTVDQAAEKLAKANDKKD